VETGPVEITATIVGADDATLSLMDRGVWRLNRAGLEGTLTTPHPLDADQLAHPGLAGAAVVLAHWLGHEVFHAGGFVAHGGAWAVMGPKEAGKTTLLAHLHLMGFEIVADDQLVVDTARNVVMAAPRALDVRPEAADRLFPNARRVRMGERARVDLAMVSPEIPLRGWIRLETGDHLAITKVPPRDRPRMLSSSRTLVRNLPPDPGALVRMAALPFYTFTRPLRWEDASNTTLRLLDGIA
jgi:hypothetical protein